MQTSENSPSTRLGERRSNRLDPTPHSCFIAQVLFTELALQIALLSLDDATLDHQQHNRQKNDGPQRVCEAGDARIHHRHRNISGVARVTKRPFCGNVRDWLVGVSRCIGMSHRPFEPAREQHSTAKKRPSEEARYRARQKGSRRPSVDQQAENQRCQVDKRRRRDYPCLILLVSSGICSHPPQQVYPGWLTLEHDAIYRSLLRTSENSSSTHSGE